MRAQTRWLALLLVVSFSSACGGGGGGSSDGPAPPTASSDASLSGLTVSAGSLAPAFAVGTTGYDVVVDSAVTSITVTPTTAHSSATVTVNGNSVASGSASGAIALVAGTNTVTVVVTAENGNTSRTYTLSVRSLCSHADTSDGTIISTIEQLRSELFRVGGDGADDVIYIEPGLYEVTEPIFYDAKGTTEKLTLVGCSSTDLIFDGKNQSRIFRFRKNGEIGDIVDWQTSNIHVAPFPSLALQGMTIRNGYCPESNGVEGCHGNGNSGAGVLVERYHVALSDVNFLNNFSAGEGPGLNGAVDLSVTDSLFENNQFIGRAFGGAAISASGNLSISNSIFRRNGRIAVYHGISADVPGCVSVNVENSLFENNSHIDLYVLSSWNCQYSVDNANFPHLTISNSEFRDGTATSVVSRGGNVLISWSRFTNNHGGYFGDEWVSPTGCDGGDQDTGHDFDCSWGGAIGYDKWLMGYGTVTIENSEFISNSAPDFGGAIDMGGSVDCEASSYPRYTGCDPATASNPFPEYDLIIRDSLFDGNISHRGAAISVAKVQLSSSFQSGNVLIERTVFRNNIGVSNAPASGKFTAEDTETSIIVAGGNILATDVTLTNNQADIIINAKGSLTCTPSC